MRELNDRVAVVTGAAGGIGRAIVGTLAGKGCRLALVDVDADGLAELARGLDVETSQHVVDVRDRAQLDVGLEHIRQLAPYPMLDLPMEQPYHIDLGFVL